MGDTAVQYTDCYLSPCQHDFVNSISTGICRQNTQFNMYSTTSKHQEGGESINMTVKIFCVCSSVDVFGAKARMDTYRI